MLVRHSDGHGRGGRSSGGGDGRMQRQRRRERCLLAAHEERRGTQRMYNAQYRRNEKCAAESTVLSRHLQRRAALSGVQ